MPQQRQKVICINGLSGVGKTTLAKNLCADTQFHLIKSATTRTKREEEKKYSDHIFMTLDEIIERNKHDGIVARSIIDNNFYCSFKSQFDENKINVYVVDDKGIEQLAKKEKEFGIFPIRIINPNVEENERTKRKMVRKLDDDDFMLLFNGEFTMSEMLSNIYSYLEVLKWL